jgi:glycosyltransferase 2 family protein
MRRIFHIVIIPVSVAFMLSIVIGQWDQVRATQIEVNRLLISISLLGVIALFLLDAYGWHLILRVMGHPLPVIHSLWIWVLSSITRYLPGGVWPYVSRASLAKDKGVDITNSSLSLYLETLMLVTSSLAVGFPSLLMAVNIPINPISVLPIFAICGLLMHPKVIQLLRFLPGRLGKAMGSIKPPGLKRIAGLYFYYVFFWILFGGIFICFVSSIYPVAAQNWVYIGSSLPFAFFSGFVVVFFPGGIGIREMTLFLLLRPFLPHSACLLISIGSRLWIMTGEGVCLMLIMIWKKYSQKASVRF